MTGHQVTFIRKPTLARSEYAPLEVLGLPEYLSRVLSVQEAIYPEHNAKVWDSFFSYRQDFPDMQDCMDVPVTLALGRYAFAPDPFDTERDGLNWALSASVVDFPIQSTFSQFKSDINALRDILDIPVVTDSFMFLDGYGTPDYASDLVGLNSPVAKFEQNFSVYLDTLTSERRKKFRRSDEELKPHSFRFELSQTPISEKEFDWIVTNLKARWGDDYLYALMQTIWSIAVSRHYGDRFYVMRVYDKNNIVFMQTLIVRNNSIMCQSIVKDESVSFNGIASYTDFQCVMALSGRGFTVFDPSCRTGLNDPESIGIAKRATVNFNVVKPILITGQAVPAQVQKLLADESVQGKPM